jgi:RHS repeat-associated protein
VEGYITLDSLNKPTYHYYLKDHEGNNRVVIDQNGTVEQVNHYYPFGTLFSESTNTTTQRYKYNSKELDTDYGLNLYDYGARYYDPILGQFTTSDRYAEKYNNFSPYQYGANDPFKYIDVNGDSINANQLEAQQMILNTLASTDQRYVQFDKNGNINMGLLLSHSSDSGNYNSLITLAQSELWTNVSLDVKYASVNNEGANNPIIEMSYVTDNDKIDKDNVTIGGTTTGEGGTMGITLLPGKGNSGINSLDEDIYVIVNSKLSSVARPESYSHEANGHALLYVTTRDRNKSGHNISENMIEKNIPLKNAIIKSKKQTIIKMGVL